MEKINKINYLIDTLEDKSEISDGSHTFDELYFHRCILFSAVCKLSKYYSWRSQLHDDGTMYENYFIVGISTPKGDFSYHFHMKMWDYFEGVEILDRAPAWDGHTADDIVDRITSLF